MGEIESQQQLHQDRTATDWREERGQEGPGLDPISKFQYKSQDRREADKEFNE